MQISFIMDYQFLSDVSPVFLRKLNINKADVDMQQVCSDIK